MESSLRIVAITNCPAGIAHTYMVAEALEQKARSLGHTIKVETQGSSGVENRLSCLLYTSPSPRDRTRSRMPSSA